MAALVPETPTPLNELLSRMLQPDPEDRPADAWEVLKIIDPQAELPKQAAAKFPPWAARRAKGRQNTLILNALHTLIASGETELSGTMIADLAPYLEENREVYLRYLQARLSRLQGDEEGAKEWRRQAMVKGYSSGDPKVKVRIGMEEAAASGEAGEWDKALEALNQAWEAARDYADTDLQAELRFERGRVHKQLGHDAEALEEFQEVYRRIPEPGHHPLKGGVCAELAELLVGYGLPRQALPLVKECVAERVEDARLQGHRHLQCAQCYTALLHWEGAEEHYAEARLTFSRRKDLGELLWVQAHQVRLRLAKGDYAQARRELKAIRHRNRGRDFHRQLLDLLELSLWLATSSALSASPAALLGRVKAQARKEAEAGFFHDVAWPAKDTCLLYEQLFQKLGKPAEAAGFAKKASELTRRMQDKLKSYHYREERPLEAAQASMSHFAAGVPVRVESLLRGKGPWQPGPPPAAPPPAVAEAMAGKPAQGEARPLEKELQLEERLKELEELKTHLMHKTEDQSREIESLKRALAGSAGYVEPAEAWADRPASAEATAGKPAVESIGPFLGEEDEKQVIEAALRRHRGNKSLAAKELKIHRRTLFEKVKKYGLENLSFLPGREEIEAALRSCGGNRSTAAKQLGMSRSSFYRRMKELGIEE
jgi:tetratricopeptide (TPR) repeat protein/DNA-binding protein Fis